MGIYMTRYQNIYQNNRIPGYYNIKQDQDNTITGLGYQRIYQGIGIGRPRHYHVTNLSYYIILYGIVAEQCFARLVRVNLLGRPRGCDGEGRETMESKR